MKFPENKLPLIVEEVATLFDECGYVDSGSRIEVGSALEAWIWIPSTRPNLHQEAKPLGYYRHLVMVDSKPFGHVSTRVEDSVAIVYEVGESEILASGLLRAMRLLNMDGMRYLIVPICGIQALWSDSKVVITASHDDRIPIGRMMLEDELEILVGNFISEPPEFSYLKENVATITVPTHHHLRRL